MKQIDESQFEKDAAILTNEEIAQRHGISERTVRRKKKDLELDPADGTRRRGNIPECITPRWDDFPRITANRALVISDIEFDDHDKRVLDLFVAIGETYGVKTAILNGDVVKQDVFSNWPPDVPVTASFDDEMAPLHESLKVFEETFDEILWTKGNHEVRIVKLTRGQIHLGYFLDRHPKVKFARHTHSILTSGGQDYYITHPKNYRQIPLSAPRVFCHKFHMNIICGHAHHQAICKDESGRFYLIEGGSARAFEHTQYKQLRDTTHPEWNLGFTLIIDGIPHLINLGNGDHYLKGLKI